MVQFAIVEDNLAPRFAPLSLLRPVFELRCGHFTAGERLRRACSGATWGAILRPELVATYQELFPTGHCNDQAWLAAAPTILVNGRWLCGAADLAQVQRLQPGEFASVARIENDWAAISLSPEKVRELVDATPAAVSDWIARQLPGTRRIEVGGRLIEYPWHLIEHNPEQLRIDFAARRTHQSQELTDPRIAVLGDPGQLFVDPTAHIDPFVVLDVRHGPIWIDAGVQLQAFTRVEGPSYIGPQTQLFRANVREGCSIGPVCRVGGEIEESIIHGYANKYHDGFLGHAYVCPWVNLGANTINSDLKNDYSSVKVMVDGTMVDSGSTKVGCFIGDHTKTALASLFNTGTTVGVMSLVLPGGELLPKVIPSFCRVWHGDLDQLPDGIESGIASARTAMGRRNLTLSAAQEALLRHTFEATFVERQQTLDRWRQRRSKTA
ncbi:MAG: hypothetical protein KDA58_05445 [Planctomycetaceae bacterium]|nr:hypothetical protein [Planctomycetaceae bacterium]